MHTFHEMRLLFFCTGEPWQQGGAEGYPGRRRHLVDQRTAHSQHQQQRRSRTLTKRRPNTSSGPQRVSRKRVLCHSYTLRIMTSNKCTSVCLVYSRTSNNGHCRGIQILSVIGGVR